MQQLERRRIERGVRTEPKQLRDEPALRQRRRMANQEQTFGDLRCECSQSGCRAAVPASAEVHRGPRGGFLVSPGHEGDDVVLAVADRYFIVETQHKRSWS